MIFRQITHDDLGCASYLVGDARAGVAAVVDPKFEIEEYLRLARYLRVEIRHILETHNHADHVSGHGRLAVATGATIHIHRAVEPAYDHVAFDDGWELELGRVRVRALHTPGHRPEHTAFALVDTDRGPDPSAVLTGDSLFVGDIARPDLAIDKDEGARGIFRSLHERLLALPDTCEVWPGHLGGSLCGGPQMDLKVSSTIGYERAHSAALQISDEEEFVRVATATLPPQPPNFENIVALNTGPLSRPCPEPQPLTPKEVAAAQLTGALLVDVRTELQYDEAHIPRALCVTALHAGFGTKLAWLARQGDGIVLVGRDSDDARVATCLAAAVGLRDVVGYLDGGMTSWRDERRPVERIEAVPLDQLHERLRAGFDMQVLDVREQAEWDEAHIPGSIHTPYHDLDALPDEIDPHRPLAVVCGSGERAAVGASLAAFHGARRVLHVVGGGVPAWRARGWPVESSPAALAAR